MNRLNQESHDTLKRQEEPLELAKTTHPGMNLLENYGKQVSGKFDGCEFWHQEELKCMADIQ